MLNIYKQVDSYVEEARDMILQETEHPQDSAFFQTHRHIHLEGMSQNSLAFMDLISRCKAIYLLCMIFPM